jgi:3-oxoacyl-[acyl-carrier protein] reductase
VKTDLQGHIALVTAGSRGLGSEIVLQLAQRGAEVAFTYLRNHKAAKELVAKVQGCGRQSMALVADAGDFAAAQRVVATVREQMGPPHILVCNAGRAKSAPIWKMKEEDWDETITASLKSAFNYIRAVSPRFMDQRSGKIVCIGSINGLRGRVGTAGYNAAKSGLAGLVKTAAAELGKFNVNVNLVVPGFMDTSSQSDTPEIVRELVLKECALQRLGTPEEVAAVVVFLCSDAARHMTGALVKVDAGQYL